MKSGAARKDSLTIIRARTGSIFEVRVGMKFMSVRIVEKLTARRATLRDTDRLIGNYEVYFLIILTSLNMFCKKCKCVVFSIVYFTLFQVYSQAFIVSP